jgi:hypothetical protein
MKTSKDTGKRTAQLIDARTVLVTEADGTGCLYDLHGLANGWEFRLQKITADGEHLGRPYTTSIKPPRCTCEGHRFGYECRHIGLVRALVGAGKVAAA